MRQVCKLKNVLPAMVGWKRSASEKVIFKALCGESANVDKKAADDWKRPLSAVAERYAVEHQFNADETAVFYR